MHVHVVRAGLYLSGARTRIALCPAIRRREAAPLCIDRAVSLDPGWISLERVLTLIALQRRESGCGDGREAMRTGPDRYSIANHRPVVP